MDVKLKAALSSVIHYCQEGYTSGSAEYCARITEELAEFPETDGIAKIRRLAAAGPTLTSKRFAYPHIQDAAIELLERHHA